MLVDICILVICMASGPWWTQVEMKDKFFGPDLFSLEPEPDYPFRRRGSDSFEMASLYLTADTQALLFRARLSKKGVVLKGEELTLDVPSVAAHASQIVDAMVQVDEILPFVSLQAMVRADVSLKWMEDIGEISPDLRSVACAVVMHVLAIEEVHYEQYRRRPAFNSVFSSEPLATDPERVAYTNWPSAAFDANDRFREELVLMARTMATSAGVEMEFLRELELTIRASVGANVEPVVSEVE